MKIKFFLLLFFYCILIQSCLNRQFVRGTHDIVSIGDSLVNDSAIFIGFVYQYSDDLDFNLPADDALISIEDQIKTTSDTTGFYFIKIPPGKYSLKCQGDYNTSLEIIDETENITKSMEIQFF